MVDGNRNRLRAAPASAEPEYDNVVRRERWLEEHESDVIRHSQNHRYGFWYECVRDGRQIAEANDLGALMNRLEADFR